MEIQINCTTCNKEFKIDQWWYNYRLKRNNNRGIFCSNKCGQQGKTASEETRKKLSESSKKAINEGRRYISPTVTITCPTCNKKVDMKAWEYESKIRKNKRNILFCSPQCSLVGRKTSEETKQKLSKSQIGISCPQRGRKGHSMSEETRKKISESRKGQKSTCDWDIVISEAHQRGLTDYVVTRKPIPDIIYVENDKLVALELEKKTNESDAKRKMELYKNMNGYGKVIIVWYSRGIKRKEWTKTKLNPEWKETVFYS